MNHCHNAKCTKCGGEQWLWGNELEDPSPETYDDTMTKYSCDCMCHCDPDYTTFWIEDKTNKRVGKKYIHVHNAKGERKDLELNNHKLASYYHGMRVNCVLHSDLTVEITDFPKLRHRKYTKKGGPEWKDMARLMKNMKKGRVNF